MLRRSLEGRMSNPFSRIALRTAYGATQLPRVAWYMGHGFAMRRLATAAQPKNGKSARPPAHTDAKVPDRRRLYSDMALLLEQDLANVEAGIYPLPADHDGSLSTLLHRSRLFFEDLPEVHRRRERGGHSEVLNEHAGKRPRYYLQNFHFQSGGWMTDESATRYDTQVEVLFNGTANATRRQALPQLHEVIVGRDQRRLRLLDIGCGTGSFLDLVKQVWPRLPSLGLDLSEPYVRHAKGHLRRWSHTNLLVGNAESIPAADASFDLVTSIFMFHELPPMVRRVIIGECARVMKPFGIGGFTSTW
jgi:2-polyprenyl-3-methyl-5-hydroxy-6-metoxy-1,4-benzoquinol methylase